MKRVVLIDCNNFFVSCERVFNPQLIGKPVVVLSSNDACIIARSQEAKALGIPMGALLFEYAPLLEKHKVLVYSSNFTLYGDMSGRVMKTVAALAADIELYSIDEAFLFFPPPPSGCDENTYYSDYAQKVRNTVKQHTGIPISIGIGPTKTLAKIANHIAKKRPEYNGIFDITNNPSADKILEETDVSEVWGIGYRYSALLRRKGITNIAQFKALPDLWVKKNMTIVGLKTLHELRGIPCLNLNDTIQEKQSITVSRLFGRSITDFKELQEAVASYVSTAAVKLRAQHSIASFITVFVVFRYHQDPQRHYRTAYQELPLATSYTPELITAAYQCLDTIVMKGVIYKKAGVILSALVPNTAKQLSTYIPLQEDEYHAKLMKMVDHVNTKWGKTTLQFAACGTTKEWKMKQTRKTPCFTTNWHELLTVTI